MMRIPDACYYFYHTIFVFFHLPFMPITIQFNGEQKTLALSVSVASLITGLPLAGKRFAVERNGEIVPKSQLANVNVCDGDKLEIVIAVGGG
jgi:sulfur carrier protein